MENMIKVVLLRRVVLAFDEDPELDDEERLWVAQTGSTVVLKGTVSCQEALDKMGFCC